MRRSQPRGVSSSKNPIDGAPGARTSAHSQTTSSSVGRALKSSRSPAPPSLPAVPARACARNPLEKRAARSRSRPGECRTAQPLSPSPGPSAKFPRLKSPSAPPPCPQIGERSGGPVQSRTKIRRERRCLPRPHRLAQSGPSFLARSCRPFSSRLSKMSRSPLLLQSLALRPIPRSALAPAHPKIERRQNRDFANGKHWKPALFRRIVYHEKRELLASRPASGPRRAKQGLQCD